MNPNSITHSPYMYHAHRAYTRTHHSSSTSWSAAEIMRGSDEWKDTQLTPRSWPCRTSTISTVHCKCCTAQLITQYFEYKLIISYWLTQPPPTHVWQWHQRFQTIPFQNQDSGMCLRGRCYLEPQFSSWVQKRLTLGQFDRGWLMRLGPLSDGTGHT